MWQRFNQPWPRSHPQQGSLLLVALVLLGVIAFSTLYLSLVINNEIKDTRFADNAMVSYYAAESGSERALWRLQQAKNQNSTVLFNALQGLTSQSAAEATDSERLYDYATTTIRSQDFTLYSLAQNVPISADIYDPEQEGLAGGATGISQANINWFLTSCTPTDASAQLEITYTPIAIASSQSGASATQLDVCDCDAATPEASGLYRCDPFDAYSAQVGGLSSGNFYRFTFRPLDGSVENLVMSADKYIPSLVTVTTVGNYRESATQVTARTLWKDVLSGIFNYVIFSEESLIKDTLSSTSSALKGLCGFCSDSTPANPLACSSGADCSDPATCTITNTASDAIDGSNTQLFCGLETSGGETSSPISQTDANACNALCNGYTYCGDSVIQSPNGSATGYNNGNEQCDDGPLNSDALPNACRSNCRTAYCGDGVVDSGEACDNGAGNGSCPAVCSSGCAINTCGG